jgi:hypothetical protein
MATNESRSLVESLEEGATDGKYRKVRPNTEVDPGMGEEITKANRRGLHPYWNYDYIDQESSVKVNPVGKTASKSSSKGSSVFDTEANQMGANY